MSAPFQQFVVSTNRNIPGAFLVQVWPPVGVSDEFSPKAQGKFIEAAISEKLEREAKEPHGSIAASTRTAVPLTFRVVGFIETTKSRRVLCHVFGPDQRPLAGSWISEANS